MPMQRILGKVERIMMAMALPAKKVEEKAESSHAEHMGDFSLEQGMTIEEYEMLSNLYVAGFLAGWSGALEQARKIYKEED